MKIETPRLILRKVTEQDVRGLQKVLGDPVVMRFSLNGPLDPEGILEYIRGIIRHYHEHGYGFLAVVTKQSHQIIGLAGLNIQFIEGKSYTEVGYRLACDYWGKGFASEAVAALIDYGFNVLGIEELISIIEPANERSIAVAKRAGMYRAFSSLYHGKNVDVYQITQAEWNFDYETAIEDNFHFLLTYFVKDFPEMNDLLEPDVRVVRSTIFDDNFNFVLRARFDEKNVSMRVSQVLQLFKEEKLPFYWLVSPGDLPKTLEKELIRQGLSPKVEYPGMYLHLDQFSFERKLADLSIQRVLEKKRLKDFADVLASIGEFNHFYARLISKVPPTLYAEGAPYEMYVGYIENEPVITGILVFYADIAGIYYLMTPPECRRKGYGTEMMMHLLKRAKEKGYHLSALQPTKLGKSLYQKLGFIEKGRFVEYYP